MGKDEIEQMAAQMLAEMPNARQQVAIAPVLFLQHPHEVEARRDVIDIHEQVGLKRLLQPVEQATGEARIIAATN